MILKQIIHFFKVLSLKLKKRLELNNRIKYKNQMRIKMEIVLILKSIKMKKIVQARMNLKKIIGLQVMKYRKNLEPYFLNN